MIALQWGTDEEAEDLSGDEPEGQVPAQKPPATAKKEDAEDKAQAQRPTRRSTGTRRAVERALAVARLESRQRELLARVLGERGYDDSDDAIARIVIGSLEPEPVAAGALSALLEIAGADPLEAGVASMDLASDRKLLSATWAVLSHYDAVRGPAPTATAKAGLAIAKAAKGLQKTALDNMRSALAALGN